MTRTIVIGILALLLGIGIGSASRGTQTDTPTAMRTVTTEVEVAIPQTPTACLDALRSAGDAFLLFADIPPLILQAYGAGLTSSGRLMRETNRELADINAELQKPLLEFRIAALDCRAAA